MGWVEEPGAIEKWGNREANLDKAYEVLFPHDTPRPEQASIERDGKSWQDLGNGKYNVETETMWERGTVKGQYILDRSGMDSFFNEVKYFPTFAGKYPVPYPDHPNQSFNPIAKELAALPEAERGDRWKKYILDSVVDNAVAIEHQNNPQSTLSKDYPIPENLMKEAATNVMANIRESYIYAQLNYLNPKYVQPQTFGQSAKVFQGIEGHLQSQNTAFNWGNQEHINLMTEGLETSLGIKAQHVAPGRNIAMEMAP